MVEVANGAPYTYVVKPPDTFDPLGPLPASGIGPQVSLHAGEPLVLVNATFTFAGVTCVPLNLIARYSGATWIWNGLEAEPWLDPGATVAGLIPVGGCSCWHWP